MGGSGMAAMSANARPAGMDAALAEARAAGMAGEVPVGACLERDGRVLARAGNRMERARDPLAHAELLVLRAVLGSGARASATPSGRTGGPFGGLADATLWVTLEPCTMCAAAISLARVGRLVFGAYDPRWGAVEHNARLYDRRVGGVSPHFARWRPEVIGGVREEECAALLDGFFASLRARGKRG